MDDVEGVNYDRKMTRLVKLEFNLSFEGLLDLFYTKLWTDNTLYKLNICHRFLSPSMNMFEVAPMGEMSISGERSSSSYNSKKLRTSENGEVSGSFSGGVSGSISSGSSSRCTSHLYSDTNSRSYEMEQCFIQKKVDACSEGCSYCQPPRDKGAKISSGVWEVECKRKVTCCVWMLRARKRAIHNFFEIMETKGPHTCVNPNISHDHCNLSSSNIAHVISTQIAADLSVSEKVLEATSMSHFGYRPSRRKIRHAREMTKKAIFKSYEESYEYLPKFMNPLLSFNHGTVVDWYFKEHDLGEPIAGVVAFKRVFWELKPCIDAFPHYIPVLLIDGTHLYDKYGGVLLTATGVDGFNHLHPVAFVVVEGENKASWSWFMEMVKKKVVLQRRDVCVILDRHKGIISVMNSPELGWCEPLSHHQFCSKHLAANFEKEFKKVLKDSIVPLCSQLTGPKFSRHWNALVAVEPRVEEWFVDNPLSHRALAFDEGKRFGIMTTNMVGSWNSAIKVARKLPIATLVKTIFHKLVAYFDQRRIEVEKQCVDGNLFTLHSNKMLNRWRERARGHYVKVFNRDTWVFTVTTLKRGQKGGNEHIVRLMENICTCNKWQTFHIPRSHVLTCCANQNLDYTSFISKWYRLDNARNVYGSAFEPLPDENAWPLFDTFPKMVPDVENIPKKPRRITSVDVMYGLHTQNQPSIMCTTKTKPINYMLRMRRTLCKYARIRPTTLYIIDIF
ncbi:uncharacterized protein LOC141684944 [Apium graveolens]|uniref:uncharacterized protein LOC141684944 n=1 Tax=Apium graveolens TaxID=4045 RepID=UPI003D7ABE3A